MRRLKLLIIVDLIALVAFVASIFSGIVLMKVLPSGFQGGRNLEVSSFLDMNRHSWLYLHDYSSLLLSAAIVLHLIMHFGWIASLLKRKN